MNPTMTHGNKRRLIVLVPEGLSGNADLARKIFRMAQHNSSDVLYLAFVQEEELMLSVARGMTTMKALTTSETIDVNVCMTNSNHWLQVLRDEIEPGDTIVCHAEQMIRDRLFKTIPIQDFLKKEFSEAVISITGFYHPWQMLSRKWLYSLLFVIGCLVILFGFGALEIQIDQEVEGITRTILLIIVMTLELGVFWAWNHVPKS